MRESSSGRVPRERITRHYRLAIYSYEAFQDKSLTPVVSIHQGTDVILYGHSLMNYWIKELTI
jgi:hypothetical protein